MTDLTLVANLLLPIANVSWIYSQPAFDLVQRNWHAFISVQMFIGVAVFEYPTSHQFLSSMLVIPPTL